MPPAEPAPAVHLACLCAAWCRTCDGYQPVLQQVAAEFAAALPGLQVRWIDIEDEADLLGDCDIETFPTLAVVAADGVRFFGPLTPQPDTLRRLLRSTLLQWSPDRVPDVAAPETEAFAARLRADAAGAAAAAQPGTGG